MESMVARGASSEDVQAQLKAWIAAHAAKNPNPTEPAVKRFETAILSNVPFAVYCGWCVTTICLIQPEQLEEDQSNGIP